MHRVCRLGLKTAAATAMIAMTAATAFAEDARTFAWSVTIGGTSDYVFRGVSQTLEDPAFQASIDASYGIAYAGIWGSNVDFGGTETAEFDLYAGIKPTWKSPLGEVTFDFGVLYYAYPGASSSANLDYVELKGGYSIPSYFIKGLTSGTTLYWSPEYTGNTGEVLTVESAASYALPSFGIFTPTLSGTYGSVYGDADEGFTAGAGSDDKYNYWNAGVSLAVEKFTFDFRYWDSNVNTASVACADPGLCDERFVFSTKVTLP